jgi:hypothetical protein
MTDRELVEQVARAICIKDGRDPDGADIMVICDKNNNPLPLWQYYDDLARAAILATLKGVREPTDGIIAAGVRQSNGYPAVPDGADVEPVHNFIMTCCWRAMMDRRIKDFEA